MLSGGVVVSSGAEVVAPRGVVESGGVAGVMVEPGSGVIATYTYHMLSKLF